MSARARFEQVAASAWFQAALTGLLSLGLAIVALRLWRADLNVPFVYAGDGLLYLMYSKAIHEHGWFFANGSLGAPFGLLMYDYPEGGWVSLLLVRLFGLISPNYVVAHHLVYLLGYPLAALAALWAMRRLGVAPAPAIALSVLYSLMPYHFGRGESHYILSLYYGLPPALSYAITTAAGRAAIPLRGHGLPVGQWLRRAAPAIGAGVLAGLMSAYYVAFALIFVGAAGIFGWLHSRRLGVLLSAGVLAAVILGAFLVQYAPSLAYRAANGTNYDVANRYLGEVEGYPLKVADLLLPVPGHPVGLLNSLRGRYAAFPSYSQPHLALGVIGAAGFVAGLGALVVAAAGRGRRGSLLARLRPIGWLTATGVAVGMLGGGATLATLVFGAYLRAWDRIAIAIAFLALAAFGVLVTRLRRRLPRSWRGPALAAVAVILLLGGAFDQAGTGTFVRNYQREAQRWYHDAAFVGQIEQRLPGGAMVYQLPYVPFPEWRRALLPVNWNLRPYLHSTDLRWSTAYMAGRDPGWQAIPAAAEVSQRVAFLRAAGFGGILVDLGGYVARESDRAAIVPREVASGLTAELGPPAVVSDDGMLLFFLISEDPPPTPADVLDPVHLRWASGFDRMHVRGEHVYHAARAQAALELTNGRAVPREVVAQLVLESNGEPRSVTLAWPDGVSETVEVTAAGVPHQRRFTLPPGRSQLGLNVAGAPPRAYVLTVLDVAVVDVSLADLLP